MEPRILETQNDKGGTYKGFRLLLIRQCSFSATISLSVPEVSLLSSLSSWTSSNPRLNVITCSDSRRMTNFCVCYSSSHPPSLFFITSFFHMDSFGLPSSKHWSCHFGRMEMLDISLVFWWSRCNYKFCLIDNSACSRHNGLCSLHFRGFRRLGMKGSSTILCLL